MNRPAARLSAILLTFLFLAQNLHAASPDRFVWIFGWGLGRDSDVPEITRVLKTAGQHGFNGAVVSFGLDTLSKHDANYFRRLETIQRVCESNRLELIPSIFSIGYGGGVLSHDPNLAEGLPVVNAPFIAARGEARFVPDPVARLVNGGFEDFNGNKFAGFGFVDQPGEVSFADKEVKHSGRAALRLEQFTANPHGHGRAMQTVSVTPHRCYRVSLWVKTEGLRPTSAFRCLALANNHDLASREFRVPATTDWRKISFLFNSLDHSKVNLYAGLWEGKAGKVWLDDWTIEDAGPVNVLHRPGTPVMVRSEDGKTTYSKGRDFESLISPDFNVWRGDSSPAALKLLPDSRIKEGERLRVSWYHPMLIGDSQVTVCMAEPELYEVFDREARLLAQRLHLRAVLLSTDEIRMGGTCQACAGCSMGELLGECVTKQAAIIRRHIPNARIYIWSDMFDPGHNAHADYYLVQGDFTGSWQHVPKDLIMAVWGGAPREQSLRFFADQGFAILACCYYDADNLEDVQKWMKLAEPLPSVRGFMYTTWQKKYGLLPAFGKLIR